MSPCVDLRVYDIPYTLIMIFQKDLNFFSSNGLFCTSFHSEPILNGYLALEDLNQSYVQPCFFPAKFGTRTYCTSFLFSFFPLLI